MLQLYVKSCYAWIIWELHEDSYLNSNELAKYIAAGLYASTKASKVATASFMKSITCGYNRYLAEKEEDTENKKDII